MTTEPREPRTAREEMSALLRMEALETAILRLAVLLDEHKRDCPHIAPPSPRADGLEGRRHAWLVARGLEPDYRPTSWDEQATVSTARPLLLDEIGAPLTADWSLRAVLERRVDAAQ